MCGIKNDVSNKKFSENPKAFFTQCFGHALNVECTVFERQYGHSNIWTQHKKFPVLLKNLSKVMQCYRKFEKTYRQDPGFRVLCPTRWTVRAESVKSILENWVALQQVCDESLDRNLETEIKGRKSDEYF